jgi:hypothetical protein
MIRNHRADQIILTIKAKIDGAYRDITGLADLLKRKLLTASFKHQFLGRREHPLERRDAPTLLWLATDRVACEGRICSRDR